MIINLTEFAYNLVDIRVRLDKRIERKPLVPILHIFNETRLEKKKKRI
jgi:hypothetical protein